MTIVTDLQYSLETRLVNKLDLMIERCVQQNPKKDALLINEGSEGEGKTGSSIAEAYYIKHKTGMEAHLFFRLQALIDFAKNTENKIIIWDEPSLDSLSSDQVTAINKDLTRLLMTVRKKRHFFIFNLTKFWKFSEYIVVDRCLGLVHMYSRREIEPGRFCYIKKRRLETLYREYRTKRLRMYNKLKSFQGSFPNIMEKYFDQMGFFVNGIPNATIKIYEAEKDKAIGSIGVVKTETKRDSRYKEELLKMRKKLSLIKGITREDLAGQLGISSNRLREWSKLAIPLGNQGLEPSSTANIITNGGLEKQNFETLEQDPIINDE